MSITSALTVEMWCRLQPTQGVCQYGTCNNFHVEQSTDPTAGHCAPNTCYQNYVDEDCDRCSLTNCDVCTCKHGKCDRTTSPDGLRHCEPGACDPGYFGIDCAVCAVGKWGPTCQNDCTCVHGQCDDDGVCQKGSCEGRYPPLTPLPFLCCLISCHIFDSG